MSFQGKFQAPRVPEQGRGVSSMPKTSYNQHVWMTQFLYLLKLPTSAAGSSGSSLVSLPRSLGSLVLKMSQPQERRSELCAEGTSKPIFWLLSQAHVGQNQLCNNEEIVAGFPFCMHNSASCMHKLVSFSQKKLDDSCNLKHDFVDIKL